MFERLKALLKNKRGEINMMWIIGLVVALVIAAALLPSAVVDITNTTKWSGAPTSVLAIVPILGVGVVAALLYRIFKE